MVQSVSRQQVTSGEIAGQDRRVAAIDLGTNSLHMVVVQINATLPAFTIIEREKDTVRLGDRDPKSGNLKPEIMKRAIATLQRFQDIARSLNVEQIVAVATSAVREAPNGREFLKQISKQIHLHVDLISGPEEARRIYLGVLSGMEFHQQPHIIIDIGGGSTELILGDGDEPRFLSSTKVGAVRLTGEFITTDPIANSEFVYLQAYIRGMMERAVGELRTNLNPDETPRMVGTSGTIETLAEIHAYQTLGEAPSPLSGYEMTVDDLQSLVNRLRKLSYSDRLDIKGMSDRRSEIIIAGALILQETMSMLGMKSLTICSRALREGSIVDWMLTHGLIENKLRYQDRVRDRSVLKIAQKYRVNLDSSERIAQFALSIFDQTQGSLHDWDSNPRELLWAAAILHNCGLYISHAAHHKHSYYLIRHGELLGYNETDVEIIANLARYHRKSAPKKKHENYQNLAGKTDRKMVKQLSAILRLAVALDRRQLGAIVSVVCDYQPKTAELNLTLHPKHPNDDCALELWSFEQKKVIFEDEYNVKAIATLNQAID